MLSFSGGKTFYGDINSARGITSMLFRCCCDATGVLDMVQQQEKLEKFNYLAEKILHSLWAIVVFALLHLSRKKRAAR